MKENKDFKSGLKKEILEEIKPDIQDIKKEIKKVIGLQVKGLLEKD